MPDEVVIRGPLTMSGETAGRRAQRIAGPISLAVSRAGAAVDATCCLFIEQFLNGLQLGLLLFLLAAGLTLVFGIMDMVNLAHGSFYMLGAYFAATFTAMTGSISSAASCWR